VPKYVHIIAAISFVIAFLLGWMAYSLDHISNPEKAIRTWILITILFPTSVYFIFVFLGGVEATYRRKFPHNKDAQGDHGNNNEMS